MSITYSNSAYFDSSTSNIVLADNSNIAGVATIDMTPSDSFLFRTLVFRSSNNSNFNSNLTLSWGGTDEDDVRLNLYVDNSSFKLYENTSLIGSSNVAIPYNSNNEIAIRTELNTHKVFLNRNLVISSSHSNYDWVNGDFQITACNTTSNLIYIKYPSLENAFCFSNPTMFLGRVKMNELQCDSISEGGCNLSQKYQSTLLGSNVSFPNVNINSNLNTLFCKIDNTNNPLATNSFWNKYPLAIINRNQTSGTFAGMCFISSSIIDTVGYTPGAAITFQRVGAFSQGNFNFHTKWGNNNVSDCPVRMTLNSNGHLGIATTTPTYPLHVNGNAYAVNFIENGTALSNKYAPITTQGNFGQMQNHATYTNFNTNPAYWGWNHVQGNTNAPNTTSTQWYREVVSIGREFPARGAGGYSLELAYPRDNQASAGVHMRSIENGNIGGWIEIGARPVNSFSNWISPITNFGSNTASWSSNALANFPTDASFTSFSNWVSPITTWSSNALQTFMTKDQTIYSSDYASIQEAIDVATTIGQSNITNGVGQANRCYVKVVVPDGNHVVTSTIVVKKYVWLETNGTFTHNITDKWSPVFHFKPYTRCDSVIVWGSLGTGVLIGDNDVDCDCVIGSIRCYNIGEEYDSTRGSKYGIKIQGYNHSVDDFSIDGGNIGLIVTGADVRIK